jgi:hypothetical protein
MKGEKTNPKDEQVELMQMKITYHEKHIQTLEKLIKREAKK